MNHARRIPNRLAELRPLAAWAVEIAAELGCPEARCSDVDLCLNEAVSNVIRHGYGDDRPHEIAVELARERNQLVMRIEDDAKAFDPLALPKPKITSLDEAPPAGRGIVLMRSAADAASYERHEGKNRLTLRFSIGD